jgi:hypothetical protein
MSELAFFAVPFFAQLGNVCHCIITGIAKFDAGRSISVLGFDFVVVAHRANPDAHREPSIIKF